MAARLTNRGDTLIEVLLSIAILSSVIGISYGTSNRAQRNTQIAQEHSEATAVAQTQLERLRALHDAGAFSVDTFPTFFQNPVNYALPGRAFCIPRSIDSPPFTQAAVLVDATNPANCNLGTIGRYKVKTSFNTATRLFEVNVDWVAPGTNPNQHLAVEYRLW